jgi:hypothetical protein
MAALDLGQDLGTQQPVALRLELDVEIDPSGNPDVLDFNVT